MTVKSLLMGAAFVLASICRGADTPARLTYALDASTSEGLDLTAMAGFAADRMYGPRTADITFSGPLTVDSTVSKESPFVILGRGKKITVNGADSGLHALPLKLCNADGVTGTSKLVFDAGKRFSGPSLDVGANNEFSYGWVNYGNVELACETIDVHDGGKLGGFGLALGVNENVRVSVSGNATVTGSSYCQLGCQTAATEKNLTAFLGITNATVTAGGTEAHNGKVFSLMVNCIGSDGVGNCRVVLGEDGKLVANTISHHGGGRSTIAFDGGRYLSKHTKQTQPLFHCYGANYKGGWSNPIITVQGINGHAIDLEIAADRVLASGDGGTRAVNLTGTGGLTKRGAGTLTLNRYNSSTCDYTGPTAVLGGGLVVTDANFRPGRGALTIAEGCFLDLNGVGCTFTTAQGAGDVRNGGADVSELVLGDGDADVVLEVSTATNVMVRKTGAGTLTVRGAALAGASGFVIDAGIVKFAGNTTASRGTVEIAAGATLDIRGVSFACGKLVNRGTILSDAATTLTLGDAADASFNNGLEGFSGGFTKSGDGTVDLYGGETLDGEIAVKEGTLKVFPGIWKGKYFKLVFNKAESSDNNQWHKKLGEFALYNAAGENVARKITAQNDARAADGSGLAEGEVRLGDSGFYSVPDGSGVLNLFDGDTKTQFDLSSGWGNEFIVLRLPEAAGNVVGYNFNNGYRIGRLVTWSLYGSEDGSSWTLLDEHPCSDWNNLELRQAAIDATPNVDGAWYNDGIPYAFSSYATSDGLVFGAHARVSVAKGATLDLQSEKMVLDRLAVDCTAGAGTITRFTPAPNGILDLTVEDPKAVRNGFEVPLTVGTVADAKNFASWTVRVNGKENKNRRLAYENGKLVIRAVGFALTIR